MTERFDAVVTRAKLGEHHATPHHWLKAARMIAYAALNELDRLDAENAQLAADNAVLQVALRRACIRPWPGWKDPSDVSVRTLAEYHIRQAKEQETKCPPPTSQGGNLVQTPSGCGLLGADE